MSAIQNSLMILTFVIAIGNASVAFASPSPEKENADKNKPSDKVQVGSIKKTQNQFQQVTQSQQQANQNKDSQRTSIKHLLADAEALKAQFQYALAKALFNEAAAIAKSSGDIAQLIWVEQQRIENLILNRDFFLASQSYQTLIETLYRAELDLIANQHKLAWAKLKVGQLQFWQADKLAEDVYKYADSRKNRGLQLQSAAVLILSQLKQNRLDYATQLLSGAKQLANLPGALGRRGEQRSQMEVELAIIEAKLLLLTGETKRLVDVIESIKQRIGKIEFESQSNSLVLLEPIQDEWLSVETKYAAAINDWARYDVLVKRADKLLRDQSEREFEVTLESLEEEYRAFIAELDDELAIQDHRLKQQRTLIENLEQILEQTRWLLLVLLLVIVFSVYQAVLRRQKLLTEEYNREPLDLAEQRYQELLNKSLQSDEKAKPLLHAIKLKFLNIPALNADWGIAETDRAIARAVLRVNKLNRNIEVMALYGPYYIIFAEGFNHKQIQTLCKTIVAECNMTNKELQAQCASQECLNGQPFTELLTQLNQKVQ